MSDQIKVELQEWLGSDRTIAEAAWVSSTDRSKAIAKTDEQVKKLVIQLAEEGHGVPFEHVIMRFWIRLPIAIDRQLVKHRISSHSGASGRYRTMPHRYLNVAPDVHDIIEKLWEVHANNDIDPIQQYYETCEQANLYYQEIVNELKNNQKDGIITNQEMKRCREFFRGMLPQHNMTETVLTINLRSLANFLKLRLKANAQPEIQQIANLMLASIKEKNIAPTAIEWLEKNDWKI
jgi:thymidylate synthase (FAD)